MTTRKASVLVSSGPQRIQLRTACKLITDGTHQTPQYLATGVPFISTANLVPHGRDFDFSKYSRFISRDSHDQLIKRTGPRKGDVLVSKCGTIGVAQVVRVDYDFSIFVGLMLVRTKPNVLDPKYLEWYLDQPCVKSLLDDISCGSSRATLTVKALGDFEIAVPPLRDQKHIAGKLDEHMAALANAQAPLAAQREAAIALRSAVLRTALDPATHPRLANHGT